MKIKELTTIGFKETPKKDYYYYHQDDFYLILQILKHHKIALLLATKDTETQRNTLDNLFIKTDAIERVYSNDEGAGLVLSYRSLKKEELLSIILKLKEEIKQSPQCHHCHQNKPLNIYLLDDEIDLLCPECFENTEHITSHKASKLGILGAFIGALIAGIIWALGYNVGYLICLDGILFSLLSFIGYQKLGHYIDKKAKFIIPIIDLCVLLIAQYFACAFSIQEAFKRIGASSISFVQALVVVPGMMSDSGILGFLLVYLFYGLILMIITLVIMFIIYKHKTSYFYTYKCLNDENS